MKSHVKKKFTRLAWKRLAKAGKIVNAEGQWITRGDSNSMHRDFHPQRS